ncbi:MAG: hypothetical protein KME13_27075 [Myxacorys californica WJT36-NPBG1]|jgi:transcriptional regulator with XRE-family HTH domain|nr:hypothetical protein [Myxacorys californica WJT36-NPBG1]
MAPKKLKDILRQNHLTIEALSDYLNVDQSNILDWLQEKRFVPKLIADQIIHLHQMLSIACNQYVKHAINASSHTIALLTYATEEDFFHHADDAALLKTVTVHRGLINRTVTLLNASGFDAYLVVFHRKHYLDWLQSEQKVDCAAARALWATLQLRP